LPTSLVSPLCLSVVDTPAPTTLADIVVVVVLRCKPQNSVSLFISMREERLGTNACFLLFFLFPHRQRGKYFLCMFGSFVVEKGRKNEKIF
jgi:hypothetical protein